KPSDVDTAVFSGARANYTVTNVGGVITVTDNTGTDGIDTLRNIERLQFTDVTVNVAPVPAVTTTPTAAAGLAFGNQSVGTTSATRAVTVRNSGNAPLQVTSLTIAGLD